MWKQKTSDAESVPTQRIETGGQVKRSVPERVADHAGAAPNAIALRASGGRAMTYGELDQRADAVAGYLRSIGVGPETVVGLALERGFERIVAALGVWRAGGAFLPLDPSLSEEQIRHQLEDAQALAVIGPAATVNRLAGAARLPVSLGADGNALAQFALRAVRETNRPSNLATVIYTSGSTGEPKGVEITQGNLAHLIDWHHAAFDVTASDTASHVAGLGCDAAIWEVWSCLSAGATLTIADDETRRSAPRLKQWLCDEQVSIAFVPTPLAELLIGMAWPAATRLRYLLTGGDTLHVFPRPELTFAVVNNYGPAECTVVATSGPMPTRSDGALPSIGKAIAGASIHILDEDGAPVAPGWPGELCIGGRGVGRGYRNRPALTAKRFIADPFGREPKARLYRTGDLASMLPNGEICFRGRVDSQVKIRGYRVEPEGIAAHLARHPAIASCVVAPRVSAQGEIYLAAYVVAAGRQNAATDGLRAFLAQNLPEYMIPAAFIGLTELPLTSSGKVDKDALPEPSRDNGLDQSGFRAPETPTEIKLAAIVAEVLGAEGIGADDNFFLIGGHSSLGAQIVIRARAAFAIELTLWHLFEARTVANLAATIENLIAAKRVSTSAKEAKRARGN